MGNPSHGRLGKLLFSTTGVGAYTLVGGLLDGTFDIQLGTVETTDHDSGLFKEFIADRATGTIDASLNYEEDDNAQQDLIDACLAGTVLFFEVQPKGTNTGNQTLKAKGFVTKATVAAPNAAPASLAISVQLTGTVTNTAQP